MKKINVLISFILLIGILLPGCGGGASTQKEFYDDAKIVKFSGGSTSIVQYEQDSIVLEDVEAWYFNHVKPGNCDYCVIVFKNGTTGVWASGSLVEVNVPLSIEVDGSYMTAGEGDLYQADGDSLRRIG